MEKHSLEECLRYCSTWSLYARWQRYMSDEENKKYNYFLDNWDYALIMAECTALEDYLGQPCGPANLLPGGDNDIKSFYDLFFFHTILLVKGDKTNEKWMLYYTELYNKEVKRINMGEDSWNKGYDFIPAIKKYKQVLIDINKGLVDIDLDSSCMYSASQHLETMNDKERADLINQSIDILSDVDIDDVNAYVKFLGDETITITKTKTDETETETKTDGTKTITKTQTDETITKTITKTESVDVILQNYNSLNNEDFISAMRKAVDKGWIKIKDGKCEWIGPKEIYKGNSDSVLTYFIGKALNLKTDVEKVKDPATDKMKEQLTYDSRQDAINRFPKEEINSLFGKSLIISQWKQIFTVQKKQVWREVIDKFFDENKENKENNIQ